MGSTAVHEIAREDVETLKCCLRVTNDELPAMFVSTGRDIARTRDHDAPQRRHTLPRDEERGECYITATTAPLDTHLL